MLAVLLHGVVCKRSIFFGIPFLSSPGAGLLVGGLYYLFIFVYSTKPLCLSVMGVFRWGWHWIVAGLWVGAGQFGV